MNPCVFVSPNKDCWAEFRDYLRESVVDLEEVTLRWEGLVLKGRDPKTDQYNLTPDEYKDLKCLTKIRLALIEVRAGYGGPLGEPSPHPEYVRNKHAMVMLRLIGQLCQDPESILTISKEDFEEIKGFINQILEKQKEALNNMRGGYCYYNLARQRLFQKPRHVFRTQEIGNVTGILSPVERTPVADIINNPDPNFLSDHFLSGALVASRRKSQPQ